MAILVSSFLYGVFRSSFSLAKTIVEIIVGGILGLSYWWSDYNLAVPMITHTLYTFTTLFVTWYRSKSELNESIFRETKNGTLQMKTMTQQQVDALCAKVFNMLDVDKDGFISLKEFEAGLPLYGYVL